MKYLMAIFLCVIAHAAPANDQLMKDCSHLSNAKEAEIALFNKETFIQLGECIAVNLIKKKPIINLSRACDEVIEDKSNPFGDFSLTKLEAIYIGQCIGVINYIYQHYNDETVDIIKRKQTWNSRYRKYSCIKGLKAVSILRASANEESNRDNIRELLCTER